MKRIGIDEVRKLQLEILNEIDRFCREHDIRYFLSDGTLLGAVRHGGYIPWDDDIDIGMLRPDYEKFVSLFNREQPEGSRFRLRSLREEPDFIVAFAKVEDTRTKMEEELDCFTEIGINIDVFPFDVIPESKDKYVPVIKRSLLYRRLIDFKKVRREKKRSLFRNAVLTIGKWILRPVSVGYLQRKIDTLARSFADAHWDSSLVYCFPGSRRTLECVIPRESFESFITVPFEGREYPSMAGYDIYLRRMYDEYMQLPPEEKRICHNITAWWR